MHWLDQLGIDYEDIDVEADADAREDMLRRTEGRFVVPVTIIGDETIIGFDRPAIKATLRKQTPSNG
jgi:glutaredoxin